MKQKILIAVALLMTSIAVCAQDEAIAVLTHESTTKTFSGREALKEAYAEATHGDLITLSSGQFEAVSLIEKAITIRGAGLGVDETYHTQPTIIYNDFTLAVPNEVEDEHITIEGIYHDGTLSYSYVQKNVEIIKCRLNKLTNYQYEVLGGGKEYGRVIGMKIYQSKIVGRLFCNENSNIYAYNCYIFNPYTKDETTSNMTLANCVVKSSGSTYSDYIYGSYLNNCILVGSLFYTNNRTVFTNCLLPSVLKPATDKHTYTNYENLSGVFKTYTGSYSETETFELRDDVKGVYVDLDGRELGIYGGVLPYNPRVAGPHISRMRVADRSTEDGKLKVAVSVDTTLE